MAKLSSNNHALGMGGHRDFLHNKHVPISIDSRHSILIHDVANVSRKNDALSLKQNQENMGLGAHAVFV